MAQFQMELCQKVFIIEQVKLCRYFYSPAALRLSCKVESMTTATSLTLQYSKVLKFIFELASFWQQYRESELFHFQ